ncbi:MAG: sulfite exporter TauE/SafE family protein [Ruminococcaceae bacterium]|nr:sulfite exporter TauE/SafE family protein [Oscillospiraceae bacterium]
MWITVIITFLVAILSGLGVGSAGLLVTWLTIAEHVPQMTAQGINLIFFIFSSGAALAVHVFRTPLLWQSLPFLLITGIGGSLLGVALASVLPQVLLRRMFGIMLILTGGMGLFSTHKSPKK